MRSSSSTSASSSTGSSPSSTPTASRSTSTRRPASGDGRAGRARFGRNPLSIAGLLAIILVMAGSHVVVARYDMLAQGVLEQRLHLHQRPEHGVRPRRDAVARQLGIGVADRRRHGRRPDRLPGPGRDAGRQRRPAGRRSRRGTARTGSTSCSSAPTSVPARARSTPTRSSSCRSTRSASRSRCSACRATRRTSRSRPGRRATCSARSTRARSTRWWTNIHRRTDLYPGSVKNGTVGYNGLKAIIGYLYGLDIKYFVEVNFDGFKKVVDTMGGRDGQRPDPGLGRSLPVDRRRTPPGLHPERDPAHGRRRGAPLRPLAPRLERLRSRRAPAAGPALAARAGRPAGAHPAAPGAHRRARLGGLDRHPDEPARPAARARLADRHQGHPLVRLRAAAVRDREPPGRAGLQHPGQGVARSGPRSKTAFTTDPADEAQRQDLASEGAAVWVLNGTSDPGFGTALAGYLEFHGLAASAPRQKPAGAVPANTVIVVYNGAETKMPDTIAYLQQTFGVTVTTKTDPAMPADIVITVGRNTPGLTAPAGTLRRADPTRSGSASARIRADGRGPRRSSGRGSAARSARSPRPRPADGRPR